MYVHFLRVFFFHPAPMYIVTVRCFPKRFPVAARSRERQSVRGLAKLPQEPALSLALVTHNFQTDFIISRHIIFTQIDFVFTHVKAML